jgi:5S rRNA maturation endonuclease (ribonuclease M5)
MKGVRRVLYRLPELLEAEPNINVFIVEGEKDADNLRREFGLVATTNVGGAGKWREDYNECLSGRPVVIMPDNDKPGRDHTEQVARSLDGIALSVKIVNLPNLMEKGDVSDWINSGGRVEDLHKIIEDTPVFVPDNLLAEEVKTAVSNPNIKTAAELLATDFPEPKFAINGILSEGVTVFAGAPKLGKSWCALGFTVAVASGGKALGTISVERGDVLYLALEDGARRLQSRLKKVLGGAIPSNFQCATSWKRLNEGGLEDLENWLKDHPDARLIVIDTIKRVRPTERKRNSQLYDSDYDAISPLSELGQKYRTAIVVIHHTRKQGSDDPFDLVSGSTGLTGAADGILVLKRSRGQTGAELHVGGRDFDEKQIALRFDKDTGQWIGVGEAEFYRLSPERQEIVDLLNKFGKPLQPKDIAKGVNRNDGSVRKMLFDMIGAGQLLRNADGNYVVAEKYRNNGNDGNAPSNGDVNSNGNNGNALSSGDMNNAPLNSGDDQSVTDVTDVTDVLNDDYPF